MHAFLSLAVLFAVPQAGFFGQGTPGVEDFVLTDKSAYLVLPPQPVGGPQANYVSWSPSGRYLMMLRTNPRMTPALVSGMMRGQEPPRPAVSVSVWDKQLNRTAELGNLESFFPGRSDATTGLRWMAGKDVAMDIYSRAYRTPEGKEVEQASILRIDAARGKMEMIPLSDPIPDGVFYQSYFSPTVAKAILIETEFKRIGTQPPSIKSRVWSIDESGRGALKPEDIQGSAGEVQWTAEPGKALMHTYRIVDRTRTREDKVFDLNTGKLAPAGAGVKLYSAPESTVGLEILATPNQTNVGTVKRSHRALWLHSTKPSEQSDLLLVPKGDAALLSPKADAVAVVVQGVVTVQSIVPMPLEAYYAAKNAAEKAKALSDVKQIGTAAIIFSTDYDDRLPSKDEVSGGSLEPYMKNAALMEGFTYTFSGGLIQNLENPATTMLGYKQAGGGYAVVFADGHAKWMKELPKT